MWQKCVIVFVAGQVPQPRIKYHRWTDSLRIPVIIDDQLFKASLKKSGLLELLGNDSPSILMSITNWFSLW